MRRATNAAGWVLAAALLLLIAVPLGALVVGSVGPGLVRGLRHPLAGPALGLSLLTSALSLGAIVLCGTALAWRMARSSSPWVRRLELLVQLPVVVPPAVAGLALLLAFGRHGVLGAWLAERGAPVAFTTAAVVLAQIFVSAPFYVQAASTAFRRLDEETLLVARSLGASPTRVFFAVVLPLTLPALLGGAAMSWARALGEFGATLMFAGNLPGVTQTLPLAIYTALESDLEAARALSVVLVVVAAGVLAVLRYSARLQRRLAEPGA